MDNVLVPRCVVAGLMGQLDPEGCQQRKARRLQRRNYTSPGPNYVWLVNVYDKLKPYGFPIHGCIGGWSRKLMWLKVTRSNNHPDIVANLYLDRSSWWINFFKDLIDQEIFNRGSELEFECLWFCFSHLIQADLDKVREHWNAHYIVSSRYDTISGRPNELYFLP